MTEQSEIDNLISNIIENIDGPRRLTPGSLMAFYDPTKKEVLVHFYTRDHLTLYYVLISKPTDAKYGLIIDGIEFLTRDARISEKIYNIWNKAYADELQKQALLQSKHRAEVFERTVKRINDILKK